MSSDEQAISDEQFEENIDSDFLGLDSTQQTDIIVRATAYIDGLIKRYNLELTGDEREFYIIKKCIMEAYEVTAEITIQDDEMPVQYQSAKTVIENLIKTSHKTSIKKGRIKRGVTEI